MHLKMLQQAKSFWKIFIPSVAIVVIALSSSILIASKLIKTAYLSNLTQHLISSASFVKRRFGDTSDTLLAQLSLLEKNEDLSVAALYAFDSAVLDNTLLNREIKYIRETLDIEGLIVSDVDLRRVLYDVAGNVVLSNDDLLDIVRLNSNKSYWYRSERGIYLVISGQIKNFADEIGRIYLVKEIGTKYLNDIAGAVGGTVIISDISGKILADNSGLSYELPSMQCDNNQPIKSFQLAEGSRYYFECIDIAKGDYPLVAVLLYDGTPLWNAIYKTNVYLWNLGAVLLSLA